MGMICVLGGVCVRVLWCMCLCVCARARVSVCVCVCQILSENKPKERIGYSRRDCVGLEVGRGRVRVSKCVVDAYVACDRARDERIERDGCCVMDAPLSLSLPLTHTQVQIGDHSLMYTQRISISLCLTHA